MATEFLTKTEIDSGRIQITCFPGYSVKLYKNEGKYVVSFIEDHSAGMVKGLVGNPQKRFNTLVGARACYSDIERMLRHFQKIVLLSKDLKSYDK